MTDFPDWQAPQAHATAISTTGAPLLRLTQNLGSGTNTALPANSTTTLLNTTGLNQPGYEGVLSLTGPSGAGTIPFVKLIIVWTDLTTGLTVGQRTFFLTMGNGQALLYYIHGQTKGNQVSITAQNLDPSVSATLTWGFNVTSHIYANDNIIQTAYGSLAPNGYTNPAGFPNAGILLDTNTSIPISSTITRLAAVYSGKAWLMVNNNGTTAIHAYLTDPVSSGSGLYGNATGRYAGWSGVDLPAGKTQQAEVGLPYGPLNLSVTNESGTAAGSCAVGLVAKDY